MKYWIDGPDGNLYPMACFTSENKNMSFESLLMDMVRDQLPDKVTRLERITLVVLREALLKGGIPHGEDNIYDFVHELIRFCVRIDDGLRPPETIRESPDPETYLVAKPVFNSERVEMDRAVFDGILFSAFNDSIPGCHAWETDDTRSVNQQVATLLAAIEREVIRFL